MTCRSSRHLLFLPVVASFMVSPPPLAAVRLRAARVIVRLAEDSSSSSSASLGSSSVSDQLDAIVSGGGAASVVPGEQPFRWQQVETDFCLTPQDSSVSGSSITKTLNRISNQAIREILVVPDDVAPLVERLPGLREDLVSTYKIAALAPVERPRDGDESKFRDALLYFDCVAAVVTDRFGCLPSIWASVSQMSEGSSYRNSWRTFVGVLREFGYDVRQPTTELRDKAFCLSMLDQLQLKRFAAAAEEAAEAGGEASASASSSASASASAPGGAADESAPGGEEAATAASSSSSSSSSSAAGAAVAVVASPTVELNALANTLERTLLYGTAEDIDRLAASLAAGRGAFLETWSPGDGGESVKYYDALANLVTQGLRVRYDQLSPAYAEGFQRLLDNLVEVLGTTSLGRGSRKDLVVLRDFAAWERDVRLNITGAVWDPYPEDMVGDWSLVETDSASLLAIEAQNSLPSVKLLPGGKLKLTNPGAAAEAKEWRMEPGPTHLDTCQMVVEMGGSNQAGGKTEASTFMGYVDRGQRIESRFSKRPIRMSGLVVKADAVTGRFTMEKSPGGEGQGWVQRLWRGGP